MFTLKLKSTAKRFIADESGLSAVEYGLLAAGIVVGLWAFIGDIGTSLQAVFGTVRDNLQDAAPAAPAG